MSDELKKALGNSMPFTFADGTTFEVFPAPLRKLPEAMELWDMATKRPIQFMYSDKKLKKEREAFEKLLVMVFGGKYAIDQLLDLVRADSKELMRLFGFFLGFDWVETALSQAIRQAAGQADQLGAGVGETDPQDTAK